MTEEVDFLKLMQLEMNVLSRRLRGMAMISRGIVPNLVLAQRVVDKMRSAASQFLADETGEAMIGLIVENDTPEGLPTIYVLDTISPDETAVRRSHTFQQGDNLQDEIIWWLQENWYMYREQKRGTDELSDRFDVPLSYVGDWHKQPGSMIQPSHGDLMTALSWLDDPENNMEYLLVPIVTVGHAPIIGMSDVKVNYITSDMDDGTFMRVDWWYIHQDVRVFQPLHPVVTPNEELPQMMKYSWHLVHEGRAGEEIVALEYDGCWVSSLILWEADEEVPLEVGFIIARAGARKLILLITESDYPETPPDAYVADSYQGLNLSDEYEAFKGLWERSEKIDVPDFEWDATMRLIDFVHAIEDHVGIERPERERVVIPVEEDGSDVSADSDEETDETRNEMEAEFVEEDEDAIEGAVEESNQEIVKTLDDLTDLEPEDVDETSKEETP